MAMRLVTQQGQRLVMTPQLQLAIQLLQLSTRELEQVIRKELEENSLPFESLGRTATSLAEHLQEQLRLAADDPDGGPRGGHHRQTR
jgi:RNA polymerase sigma-54 factor